MSDKTIVKMMQKKTSVYLKISMVLFLLSLISVVTFLVYIQYQYKQMKYNFIDNSNTHIIEINHKKGSGVTDIYQPSFQDEDAIKKLLVKHEKSIVYFAYNINFGMLDQNENSFFIKSISDHAMESLGVEKLGDDMAYCYGETEQKEIVLQIPHINVVEGGFSSSSSTAQPLKLIPLDTITQPFSEMKHFNDIIYVNENTFKGIIEHMYDTKWELFVNAYESGENTGIQMLDKIYIYIQDIKDVSKVAAKLEGEGYVNKYVLNAFDNLYGSVNINNILLVGMLIFILSLTTYNVINSFRSYIYTMKKDMGILMHYGYSKKRVYDIYKGIVLRPFIFVALLLFSYTVIISLMTFRKDILEYVLWSMLMLVFILSVVTVRLSFLIKKVCKVRLLTLLKASKTSE